MEDDDIIILSSDDEDDVPFQTNRTSSPRPASVSSPMSREVKVENVKNMEAATTPNGNLPAAASSTVSNNDQANQNPPAANEHVQVQQQEFRDNITTNFPFDAFALFGPSNPSVPIEERLHSFINNVQSLTEDKAKLEQSERQTKKQYEETRAQLNTSNQEVSKLRRIVDESSSKLSEQSDSISELRRNVEKLQREESGSKAKLKSITNTLAGLQSQLIQVLQDTEVDTTFALPPADAAVPIASCSSTEVVTGSLSEAVLKENILQFEKDFEVKFSRIEDQDKEIKLELERTNEMLHRIQVSLTEQFNQLPVVPIQLSPASSPQLTYDQEDQEMGEEQEFEPVPGSSRTTVGGSQNGQSKKVSTLKPEISSIHNFFK